LHIELWARGQGHCVIGTGFSGQSGIASLDLKPQWTHYSFDCRIAEGGPLIPVFGVAGTMFLDDVSIIRAAPKR
jgi:hypothetical protein